MFEINGKDTEFFKLAIVARGKKATLRSVDECVLQEKVRTYKVFLTVCFGIVLQVRQQYWVDQEWDAKGMDKKAIWLAICLGFDSGLKIGNLTKRDGPNGSDHCIRASNLSFLAIDP